MSAAGQVAVQLLGVVATLAPGLLAQLTGRPSDEAAIAAAREAVARSPSDVADAWDADLARRVDGASEPRRTGGGSGGQP